ncbi:unnamed protein product [Arctia plantaginis]|uniref:PID domain-containing protein n=1 Tax=Arctia plantaginis TaxID=874455 RepID=A0A8S1A2U6_ARCPL|nr:unnamed protein product [Arctia plantaginis]
MSYKPRVYFGAGADARRSDRSCSPPPSRPVLRLIWRRLLLAKSATVSLQPRSAICFGNLRGSRPLVEKQRVKCIQCVKCPVCHVVLAGDVAPSHIMLAVRHAKYLGSFPVPGGEPAARGDAVSANLHLMKENGRAVPVLVVVALSGVKVCDPDDQSVRMHHALRRISYATCEAARALFALVAREPRSEPPHHYCHAFHTDTPEQRLRRGVKHLDLRFKFIAQTESRCRRNLLHSQKHSWKGSIAKSMVINRSSGSQKSSMSYKIKKKTSNIYDTGAQALAFPIVPAPLTVKALVELRTSLLASCGAWRLRRARLRPLTHISRETTTGMCARYSAPPNI